MNNNGGLITFGKIIKACIPKKFILKCYNSDSINYKDLQKLVQKLDYIEKKVNQLNHVKSIVEKCILKADDRADYMQKLYEMAFK